jgi:mono/diheme cytochrome c family protein
MYEMDVDRRRGYYRKVFLGMTLGAAIILAGFFLCLKFAPLPVAVADRPFPFEKQIVKIPLRARISRQMERAPFGANEEVFESGAHIYKDRCSICHGTPGHDAAFAQHMYPPPPQMWKKHGTRGAVGVSEFEPGMTYWFVANGVRLSGMPSFRNILSDAQMWQVSLLLKNADKEHTPAVSKILSTPNP